MKTVLSLFLIMSLSAVLAHAQYDTHVIIYGGGNKPEDAQKAITEMLNNEAFMDHFTFNSKTLMSDTIKGLNPGFYFACIGFCEDEDKAKIIVNEANKYAKGVYSRKISLKSIPTSVKLSPIVKCESQPFEGAEYTLILNSFGNFTNDPSDIKGTDKFKPKDDNKVIVKTDKVSFTRKIGSFDTNFYLAWFPSNKKVLYISEFQFTRINLDYNPISDCSVVRTEYEMGEFPVTRVEQNCTLQNGVSFYHLTDFEADESVYNFQSTDFTFKEILNYSIGTGMFSELLKKEYPNGDTEDESGFTIKISDDEVSFDDGHSWEILRNTKEGIKLIFGGGA